MQCFKVPVLGRFDHHVVPVPGGLDVQGFYATRCIFASNRQQAAEKAFAKVREDLAKQNDDVRDGLISIKFEAEEIEPTAWWNVFRRYNRGYAFYAEE